MKLLIDFVSQQGNASRNDCGAACVAMCAGSSTDKVLAAIEQPLNKSLTVANIMQALGAYRLGREYVRPLHLPDLRRWLANGNPVIALVGYKHLPPEQRAVDFDGSHFVLVVGFTAGGFLVHDPLWADGRGAYREWSTEVMGTALARPGWGNMMLQGVVVQQVYEIVEADMGELGLAVSAAMREGTAVAYLEQVLGAMGFGEGPLAERVGHALAWVVARK